MSIRRHAATILRVHAMRLLAALTLGTAFAQGAGAQTAWNTIGPAGGTVAALLVSPMNTSTLYAGTPDNGVFISNDAGVTWAAANNGLPPSSAIGQQKLYTVYSLVSDGQSVYAATASGLYVASLGAPVAWTALAATASTTPITLLAFDAATARLFAASSQTDGVSAPGVYVASLAGGPAAASWTFAPLPVAAGTPVGALAVVPAQGGGVAGLMAGVGGRLFTASIQPAQIGPSWIDGDPSATLSADTIGALSFSADFQQAYACSGGQVFHSGNPLDSIALWAPASVASTGSGAAIACNTLATVPIAAGGAPQIMLGSDQGAFVSVDGTSFQSTGSVGVGTGVNAFAVGLRGSVPTLFAGVADGVAITPIASLTAGATWTQANGPASVGPGGNNLRLNDTRIVDTGFVGTTIFAAAASDQYVEVFASSDGGASWTATGIAAALNAGETVIGLAGDDANQVLYVATTQGLLAYKPAGATWSVVAGATLSGRAGAIALGATALFVGTDNGLFAVARGNPVGATATAAGLAGSSVRSVHVAGGNVYAGTIDSNDENFVFTASESAATAGTAVWNAFAASSAGTHRISSLLLVGDRLFAATKGGLVLYATAGSAWASANQSADPAQQISDAFGVVNSLYSDGSLIYAATGSNGVFVSPASASAYSWTPYSGSDATALPTLEVNSLRASGGILFAATRAGIATSSGPTGSGSGSVPPVVPPTEPPTTVASSGDSGGGAFDPMFGLLFVAGAVALRARTRTR